MEKRKTMVIAAIVVAIFVTSLSMGCVDQQKQESVKKEPDSSDSNEVLLTAADNCTEVGVKNGQTLVIALDSNPTTGYEWEVAEAPNEQVL